MTESDYEINLKQQNAKILALLEKIIDHTERNKNISKT